MIKYFTIEDLLKHYLQKKFHTLTNIKDGIVPKRERVFQVFLMLF